MDQLLEGLSLMFKSIGGFFRDIVAWFSLFGTPAAGASGIKAVLNWKSTSYWFGGSIRFLVVLVVGSKSLRAIPAINQASAGNNLQDCFNWRSRTNFSFLVHQKCLKLQILRLLEHDSSKTVTSKC